MGTGTVEFRQLWEGRVFFYLIYSLAKSHFMVRDIRGPEWSFIQFQKLGLSGEIPIVVLDSPETDHGLYLLLVC